MSLASPAGAPGANAPHVLMTTDTVGGVWTHALDLGRELVGAGVRVTLAVIGPPPDPDACAQAEATGLHVRDLGGELDWTADSEAEVATSAARLFALAADLRPQLLHLNSPALAAFGAFPVPVLAACHSCVATWWSAVKGDAPLPPDLAWRARLTARGYAAADALLAPSRAFAKATQAAYALASMPHVVLNGSSGHASPAPPAEDSPPPLRSGGGGATRMRRDGGGAAAASAWVFTAGRLWDEGKDVATLDRAVGRAALPTLAAGPLAGPGGQSVELAYVACPGRLSAADLHARLAGRPIFVSPSLYEPFGLAVLEAAQAGCPLVLSDIATFRELWDGAAVFFAPGDDLALANQLQALATDPDRRTALGDAARTRAARYTAAAMADATLQLYARLSPAFARVEAAA